VVLDVSLGADLGAFFVTGDVRFFDREAGVLVFLDAGVVAVGVDGGD
jgi:hypothetical protein